MAIEGQNRHTGNAMGQPELEYLLNHMTEALEAPDPHFDCIHMLSDLDWHRLRQELGTQTSLWREAFAYVLSEGPVCHSVPLLSDLLRDTEPTVAQQAALSIVDFVDANPEVVIPAGNIEAMRQLVLRSPEGLDEVVAFLDRS